MSKPSWSWNNLKTIFHLAKQARITIGSRSLSPFPNPVPSIIPQSTISAELMQTFSDKVKDHLPDFLKNIADNAISDEDADLLILGTLTVISACLPNISGIYAGREVFPNLFLFVTAQASSGKGRLFVEPFFYVKLFLVHFLIVLG